MRDSDFAIKFYNQVKNLKVALVFLVLILFLIVQYYQTKIDHYNDQACKSEMKRFEPIKPRGDPK